MVSSVPILSVVVCCALPGIVPAQEELKGREIIYDGSGRPCWIDEEVRGDIILASKDNSPQKHLVYHEGSCRQVFVVCDGHADVHLEKGLDGLLWTRAAPGAPLPFFLRAPVHRMRLGP